MNLKIVLSFLMTLMVTLQAQAYDPRITVECDADNYKAHISAKRGIRGNLPLLTAKLEESGDVTATISDFFIKKIEFYTPMIFPRNVSHYTLLKELYDCFKIDVDIKSGNHDLYQQYNIMDNIYKYTARGELEAELLRASCSALGEQLHKAENYKLYSIGEGDLMCEIKY